jgi:biopolymer transport protein ExbB/TolQ
MFGWDYHNSKSDRIKLFLFILTVFLVVGFTVTTILRSMNKVEVATKNAAESTEQVDSELASSKNLQSAAEENENNEYDQTNKFSEEILENTKEIAVQFTTAFHTYNALYEKMKRNGRREILERSYLTVKETQITPVSNKSSMVVRWNVMVMGEAKSVDGTTSETEDWYLVGLREVDGEWKVEDVRVNVSS